MSRSRRCWSRQQKADIVRRYLESGQAQGAFAKVLGIHSTLLGKWIRLAKDGKLPDPTPVLLPVHVRPKREVDPLEVVLESGLRVRVPSNFDEDSLKRLLGVLDRC